VLPPIRPGQPGHSPDRSPYRVSLTAVIERLATSSERIKILRGLIAYRIAFTQTAGPTHPKFPLFFWNNSLLYLMI
jgi:hypothetical protein